MDNLIFYLSLNSVNTLPGDIQNACEPGCINNAYLQQIKLADKITSVI